MLIEHKDHTQLLSKYCAHNRERLASFLCKQVTSTMMHSWVCVFVSGCIRFFVSKRTFKKSPEQRSILKCLALCRFSLVVVHFFLLTLTRLVDSARERVWRRGDVYEDIRIRRIVERGHSHTPSSLWVESKKYVVRMHQAGQWGSKRFKGIQEVTFCAATDDASLYGKMKPHLTRRTVLVNRR